MRGTRAKMIRRASYHFTPPELKMQGPYWAGKTYVNGGIKRMYRLLKNEWNYQRTLGVQK